MVLSSIETFDFVPHMFNGLMLPATGTKELFQAVILERLSPSFFLSEECPGLTPEREDGDIQGFVSLYMLLKLTARYNERLNG